MWGQPVQQQELVPRPGPKVQARAPVVTTAQQITPKLCACQQRQQWFYSQICILGTECLFEPRGWLAGRGLGSPEALLTLLHGGRGRLSLSLCLCGFTPGLSSMAASGYLNFTPAGSALQRCVFWGERVRNKLITFSVLVSGVTQHHFHLDYNC